jgi:hypothetical protein
MTFLEVLDDAVKIGLGGFIGWLISKGTRSHEFEKERRRRKQDCLERVVEDLDEHQSAFYAWCSQCRSYRMVADKKDNPALEKAILVTVNKRHNVHEEAETKLIRSRSKLIVFGFDRCAAALDAYHKKLISFVVVVHNFRAGTEKLETYTAGRAEIRKYADNLRDSITKAFAGL